MVFDIKDWEKIDFDLMYHLVGEVESMQGQMYIIDMITTIENIKNKQLQAYNKSIPAILRK